MNAPRPVARGDVLVALTFVALFAALLGEAVQHRPEARFAPLAVGIPALALALLQFGIGLRNRAGAGTEAGIGRAMVHLAWFAGLIVLTVGCGVLVAFPLFVAAFLWRRREVGPKTAAAIAVGFTAAIYLIFEQLLGLYLWRGLWAPLFG